MATRGLIELNRTRERLAAREKKYSCTWSDDAEFVTITVNSGRSLGEAANRVNSCADGRYYAKPIPCLKALSRAKSLSRAKARRTKGSAAAKFSKSRFLEDAPAEGAEGIMHSGPKAALVSEGALADGGDHLDAPVFSDDKLVVAEGMASEVGNLFV